MILRYDNLHTLGHDVADWVTAREYEKRATEQHQRARHNVRAPFNSSASGNREPGHDTLREALITHFARASSQKELGWVRSAASARPRATATRPGTQDCEEDEPEEDGEEDDANVFDDVQDSDAD